VTTVELTEAVQRWVRNDLVATRLRPLEVALAKATPAQRAAIGRALATLERLITSPDR
jgi:hypothetical protein